MEAKDRGDDRKKEFYEVHANKHRKRVSLYLKEIAAMKAQSPVLSPSSKNKDKDATGSSNKKRRQSEIE
jgi:hypothetical protein